MGLSMGTTMDDARQGGLVVDWAGHKCQGEDDEPSGKSEEGALKQTTLLVSLGLSSGCTRPMACSFVEVVRHCGMCVVGQ